MKRLIWLFAALIFMFGCKNKTPKGVLDRETMEGILYDIHVVDGYLSTIYLQDSAKKVGAAYYKGIYEKFDTDSAQYVKSLNYYTENSKELQEIYTAINKKLERSKAGLVKAEERIKKDKFRVDSLKIIKTFKADSLAARKKIKSDSLSVAKFNAQIKKKRKRTDSLIQNKRFNGDLQTVSPTAVQ